MTKEFRMAFQKTLKDKLVFTGVGLHSGKTITMTVRPAEAGTGIVFHRVDLSPPVSIEAIAANVVNTRLSTTIGKEGAAVSTIEHLMAALYGCGIDNAHIDINGQEVPIMDGSAEPFVVALHEDTFPAEEVSGG
jgi:UDP-3-O-[3-hydroxymyristoyl] N-acetylglucosamine deacetylase